MKRFTPLLAALALVVFTACDESLIEPTAALSPEGGPLLSSVSTDGLDLIGGLDMMAFCGSKGYPNVGYRKGYISGHENAAYDNWVCQFGGDQFNPVYIEDANMTAACRWTYDLPGVFAVAQDPDHAWSWACFVDPTATVYDFDELPENCAWDAAFPNPYQGLVFTETPYIAVCSHVDGTVLIPTNSAWEYPVGGELRFKLPRPASAASIEVWGPSSPTLNAYDANGVLVSSASGDPAGWRIIAVAGDIHEVGLWAIQGDVLFDDLRITYIPEPSDDTPPVITADVSGTTGDNGWFTFDVQIAWSVTDDESPVGATDGCGPVAVTEDTDGATFTCTATSDGGTAVHSVTVKRDATPPTIAFAGNLGAYTVDADIAITCSAADAMSGLAASDCPAADGPAYLFELGTNTMTAHASDNAGLAATLSTTFTVAVTEESLCALTRRWVDRAGIAQSMCVKLEAAARSGARGNGASRAGQIGAYINQVAAQAGKALSEEHAAILIRLAGAL